jgi:hypothetical protein
VTSRTHFSDFKDMSLKLTNILRVLNQQQLTDAYSANGTVEPSKNAALLPLMVATNSGVPVGCSKDMWDEFMCTVKPILRVRYGADSRLFVRSGTCKTLVNSTALTLFSLITGLNTTVPTPAECTILLSASLIGTRLGV